MQVIITFEHMLAKRIKFMDTMLKKREERLKATELKRQADLDKAIERNIAQRFALYHSLEGKPCLFCKDPVLGVTAADHKLVGPDSKEYAPICSGCANWYRRFK